MSAAQSLPLELWGLIAANMRTQDLVSLFCTSKLHAQLYHYENLFRNLWLRDFALPGDGANNERVSPLGFRRTYQLRMLASQRSRTVVRHETQERSMKMRLSRFSSAVAWFAAYMIPLLLVCVPVHMTARALDGKASFVVASLPITLPTVGLSIVTALVSDAKMLYVVWVGFCWLLPALHADGYLPVLSYFWVLFPHFAALMAGFVAGVHAVVTTPRHTPWNVWARTLGGISMDLSLLAWMVLTVLKQDAICSLSWTVTLSPLFVTVCGLFAILCGISPLMPALVFELVLASCALLLYTKRLDGDPYLTHVPWTVLFIPLHLFVAVAFFVAAYFVPLQGMPSMSSSPVHSFHRLRDDIFDALISEDWRSFRCEMDRASSPLPPVAPSLGSSVAGASSLFCPGGGAIGIPVQPTDGLKLRQQNALFPFYSTASAHAAFSSPSDAGKSPTASSAADVSVSASDDTVQRRLLCGTSTEPSLEG